MSEGRTNEHWVRLDAQVDLQGADAATEGIWSVDVRVTGTLRSATQRVIEADVDAQVRAVLDAVGHLAAKA